MPFIIWITGLPSSGKTTLGGKLYDYLKDKGFKVIWLDSDELRRILTPNPKYTTEERDWFYSVLAWLAKKFYEYGVNVIISATANKRVYRDRLRSEVNNFIEVYLKCDIRVCMARDTKGVYRLALNGKSSTVPGVGVEYEEPINPDILIETDKYDVNDSFKKLVFGLKEKGVV